MKRIFSIFVATLLLSTTLLAQNVAKVTRTADGTLVGEYPTMSEALAAWTDGTTLTMLGDATYTATATYTVTGTQTLDLAGKTLTWNAGAEAVNVISLGANAALNIQGSATSKGVLSFTTAAKAVQVFNVDKTTKSLNINGVKVEVNATGTGDGRVIYAGNSYCSFSVVNTDFSVQNNIRRILETGVYLGEGTCQDRFEDITIDFAANCTLFGIQALRTERASLTLQNCEIDMSKITGRCQAIYLDKKCDLAIVGGHYLIGTGRTTNSVVEFGDKNGSSCSIKKGTAEPVFNAPIFIPLPNPVTVLKTNTMNVECGKFFTALPPYTMAPEGKHFEQKSENGKSYYALEDGAYVLGLRSTLVGYTDAQKCISDAGNSAAIDVLSPADFTVPAGKTFSLYNESSNKSLSTITNEGKITISTSSTVVKGNWSNFKIVNNGSLTIGGSSVSKPTTQMYVDNVTIENKGTLTLTGYSTLDREIHYGKDFKIDNKEGGSVSVSSGFFATEAKSQIENYLAEGYSLYSFGDGYRVATEGAMVAQVGEKQYNDLAEALAASSKDEYAKLLTNFPYSALKVNGRNVYLDLNGKTLTLTSGNSFVENGSLTIKNGTLNCTDEFVFDMYGSTNPSATNYSVLNIESDVTITQAAGKEYFAAVSQVQKNQPYGVVVNFNGTYEGQCPFYIHGSLVIVSDNTPTFNIGKDAKITANSLAYAAGYGIWNYEGTATTSHHGFEIRAGKLTMNGGSIVCTATEPADDQFNGNGSTSQACGIAVCQHSSKLPINVVVKDGYIKAYTPLYQSNPQNNETDMKQINLTVNGGKFFSTSKNIVYSLNKRIFLNGGVYNMNPSAYAAEGKVVVANTGDDKDVYPYAIGDVKAGVTFNKEGDWSTAANWSGTATAETPVTIAANVTISGKAEAYGITVSEGKTITIKKGGVLVVGKNGIAGVNSADQLIIEDGGYLLISPAATANNQPLATVVRIMNTQKKADGTYEEGESPYVRYYMGIPTVEKPTIDSKGIQLYARDWDVNIGWKDATEFKTMFKGYGVTSEELNKQASFAGQLIGNRDAALAMPCDGFHFFANGWMTPMDMYEVLNQLDQLKNNGSVEAAVTVCVAEGQYQTLTRDQLFQYPDWEQVSPLNTYFLHANQATTINVNYEKAAWNVQLAEKSAAPKRMMVAEEENNAVRIKLIAANGRQDNVYIYDGKEFHSTKMMNTKPNVNIFVEKEGNNYSTFASEDLEGTAIGIQTNSQTNYSLAFDFVKGETLYIKDLQTGVVTAMTEGNVYNFTATANETSHRFVVSRHNAPTAIEGATVNTAAKGVYSIAGQYLGESNVLETLPQGIYVVDGKKYIK